MTLKPAMGTGGLRSGNGLALIWLRPPFFGVSMT